ncbi:hypothetical protein EME01_37950 [Sinorhizobium meliloti]|nr:hypothetical protein EME01_37950 [Sinorhizobium meliloti]
MLVDLERIDVDHQPRIGRCRQRRSQEDGASPREHAHPAQPVAQRESCYCHNPNLEIPELPRIVPLFSLYGKEMAKPIHLAAAPIHRPDTPPARLQPDAEASGLTCRTKVNEQIDRNEQCRF